MILPNEITVAPLPHPPHTTISVPGSKSITNRALVLAALSTDQVHLHGALKSEDTEVMVEALRALGFSIETDWDDAHIQVRRDDPSRVIPADAADLFVANSGTTMRFLTAMVCLGRGKYRLDGVARMRERPIEDLLAALRQVGVDAASELGTGCPPVVVQANGLPGGTVTIKGDISSQFLSGLLMAAPLAVADVDIHVEGSLVSEPYVTMTLAMMRQFGAVVEVKRSGVYHVPGRQSYQLDRYDIEPDASAASYFLASAAICGGEVGVLGLPSDSLQGDIAFVDILERMGCRVRRDSHGVHVQGGKLKGVEVDMNAVSDTVMTLAAVACFAAGPTTIRNVAHIRHKETDRIAALAAELRKVGVEIEERADGLTIVPGPLRGAVIDTYDDHRMAMSMALIGLRIPGIVVRNPKCTEKTYPGFFGDLEKLRGG